MFFKPILDKEAKLLRHDGTIESAHRILRQVLCNHPMALRIQEELVDECKSILDTGAGEELNRQLFQMAETYREELRQVMQEVEDAIKARDEEMKMKLTKEREDLEKEISRMADEMDKLKFRYNEQAVRNEGRIRELESAREGAQIGTRGRMEQTPDPLREIFMGIWNVVLEVMEHQADRDLQA